MNNFYKYFNDKFKKQKDEKFQQLELEIEPPKKIEDKTENNDEGSELPLH